MRAQGIGDRIYGGVRPKPPAHLSVLSRLDRPFLHAARLTLKHPITGERMTFEAPLPAELADVLTRLRAHPN